MIATVPLLLGTVAMLVSAQLLLKAGMTAAGPIGGNGPSGAARVLLGRARDPRILAGFVLYVMSAAFWVYVLSRVELTYAFPFLALGYVGVFAGAVVWLGEKPTRQEWIGIVLVVAGVALVAFSMPG